MIDPAAITQARPSDAGRISQLIEHSVRRGCFADHGGDPQVLASWLGTKGAATIRAWLADEALTVRVVRQRKALAGVGIALRSGEICQCHVLPELCGRGLGRALMLDLEQRLRGWGLSRAMLYSTDSAAGFFRRLGYRASGAPLLFCGLRLQAMQKTF